MTRRSTIIGWWMCCACNMHVNSHICGDSCADCGHVLCEVCHRYGGYIRGSRPALGRVVESINADMNAPKGISTGSAPGLNSPGPELQQPRYSQENTPDLQTHDKQADAARSSNEEVVSILLKKWQNTEDDDKAMLFAQSGIQKTSVNDLMSLTRVSSLESISDSLFSIASGSSRSSIQGSEVIIDHFVMVLLRDTTIQSLCSEAASKIAIDRLERNLRRLLNIFATELQKEAANTKQQQAARFVRLHSRTSAWLICDEFSQNSKSKKPPGEASDDSDDETYEDDIYEDSDSQYFEEFIVKSQAFETLRENLRQFVQPLQTICLQNREPTVRDLLSDLPFADVDLDSLSINRLDIADSLKAFLKTLTRKKNILMKSPRLAKNMKRVTWTCSCGKHLYDDYEVLERGAAKQFEKVLRKTFTARNRQHAGSFHAIHDFFYGFRSITLSLINGVRHSLQKTRTNDVGLPSFEIGPQTQPSPSMPEEPVATKGQLFLLLCMNDGKGASTIRARQPNIHDIDSDRKLFQMLRDYHTSLRKRWWSCISLWELQHIYFVHFEMYDKHLVDIKELHTIPPSEMNTSYQYERSNLKPPIGSNLLMHYFRCPQDATILTPCLRKIPKKISHQLTVCPMKGISPGWGLHLVEGWNWKKILTGSCLVFIVTSTAIGVLCWKFEHSIQDAFAMGGFVLACFGTSIATLQVWLNMP